MGGTKLKAEAPTLLMTVVFALYVASIFSVINEMPEKPKIYVDPEHSVFFRCNDLVGDIFTVSVKTANWAAPGVFAYEISLRYNSTLLNVTWAEIPKDHWLNSSQPIIDFVPPLAVSIHEGVVSAAVSLLDEEPGRTGGGTLFAVTFQVIHAPPRGGKLACTFELEDAVIVNPEGEAVPSERYEILDGNYLISAAGDLNGDGRANILDMAIWAVAFHSYPGHARWNQKADLNGDGKINIVDATSIARAWTG